MKKLPTLFVFAILSFSFILVSCGDDDPIIPTTGEDWCLVDTLSVKAEMKVVTENSDSLKFDFKITGFDPNWAQVYFINLTATNGQDSEDEDYEMTSVENDFIRFVKLSDIFPTLSTADGYEFYGTVTVIGAEGHAPCGHGLEVTDIIEVD